MSNITLTPINDLTGSINFNLPPEMEATKTRIYGSSVDPATTTKEILIRDVGIAAGVKNMVYTEALDEEEQMPPADVEKEICLVCHNEIWELGKKNDLTPLERRDAWVKALETISQIVRATYPQEKVNEMEPFDKFQYEFLAGPEADEPVSWDEQRLEQT